MEHPDNMAAPKNIEPSYECPVCGIEDETAFMRCYRPNCTDGRDRHGRTYTMPQIRARIDKLETRIHIMQESRAPRLAGRFLIGFLYGIVILLLLNLFSLFC